MGCRAGHRSGRGPFPRAALKPPSPMAGGSQASGAALRRRGRQAAPAGPPPASRSPAGARPASGTLAGGAHGLLPGQERAAVSEQRPDPSATLSRRAAALADLWLEETQDGLRGACSSRRMAAFCSFSSAGEAPLRHSAQQLWGVYKCGVGSRASLGSSPARVGSRVASEGRGAPVYSSSRQRCRESWLSAPALGRGGAGQDPQTGSGSPWSEGRH